MIHKFKSKDVFYFEEQKLKLWYSDVANKNARPYVLIFINNTHMLFVPAMSKYDSKGRARTKAINWVDCHIYDQLKKVWVEGYLQTDKKIWYSHKKVENAIYHNSIKHSANPAAFKIKPVKEDYLKFYNSFN